MNIMAEEDFGYPPQRYPNPPVHSLNQQTVRHQQRTSGSAAGMRQLVRGDGNDLASLRGGRIRKPKPWPAAPRSAPQLGAEQIFHPGNPAIST